MKLLHGVLNNENAFIVPTKNEGLTFNTSNNLCYWDKPSDAGNCIAPTPSPTTTPSPSTAQPSNSHASSVGCPESMMPPAGDGYCCNWGYTYDGTNCTN